MLIDEDLIELRLGAVVREGYKEERSDLVVMRNLISYLLVREIVHHEAPENVIRVQMILLAFPREEVSLHPETNQGNLLGEWI